MLMLVNLFPLVNSKKLQSVENMWTSLLFFFFSFIFWCFIVQLVFSLFVEKKKMIKIPFFPSIKHPLQNRSQTTHRSTYTHTQNWMKESCLTFPFLSTIFFCFFLFCFLRCHSSIEWRRKIKRTNIKVGETVFFVCVLFWRKGKKTKDSKISGTITLQFHLPTQLSNRWTLTMYTNKLILMCPL